MMNYIWCALILASLVYGGAAGNAAAVSDALLSGCSEAVTLCVSLCGGYMLYLGLFKIAERAGLVKALAQRLTPALIRLFPDSAEAIPEITLNLAANFFGLGSAATPFGLAAMRRMQAKNPTPERATNDMCLFMGLNCAAVELIPAGVIALRAAYGSAAPAAVAAPAFVCSLIASSTSLGLCLLLRKRL